VEDEGFKLEKLEVTKEEIFKDSGMTAFSKKGNSSESNNQDDYCIYADPYIKIFAVFDGHGKKNNLSNEIKTFSKQGLLDILCPVAV
jgi:serine/threonine protein phosphatase PrpC